MRGVLVSYTCRRGALDVARFDLWAVQGLRLWSEQKSGVSRLFSYIDVDTKHYLSEPRRNDLKCYLNRAVIHIFRVRDISQQRYHRVSPINLSGDLDPISLVGPFLDQSRYNIEPCAKTDHRSVRSTGLDLFSYGYPLQVTNVGENSI